MKSFGCVRGVSLGFCAVFFVSQILGCSSKVGGDVKGTVTLDGKPVPSGFVTFVYDNGQKAGAEIGDDGTYWMVKPPKGDAKVTIESIQPPADSQPGLPAPSTDSVLPKDAEEKAKSSPQPRAGKKPTYMALPEKYKNPKTCGFTISVTGSSQSLDLPLTSK